MVDQSNNSLTTSHASIDDAANHKISSSKDLLKSIDWPFDTPELYKIAFNFFKGLQLLQKKIHLPNACVYVLFGNQRMKAKLSILRTIREMFLLP